MSGIGKVSAAAHSHTCVQVQRVAAACQAYPHEGAVQGRAGNESCLTSSCALQPCIGARSGTKSTHPAQAGAQEGAGASFSPAEGKALQKVCACYLQRPAPLQNWPGTFFRKPREPSIDTAWLAGACTAGQALRTCQKSPDTPPAKRKPGDSRLKYLTADAALLRSGSVCSELKRKKSAGV